MAQGQHCDDLRNVREGDSVELTNTNGETFEAECTSRQVRNADPRSGEIRETTLWVFDSNVGTLAASIVEGLKSSPDDPDFPVHKEMWNSDDEEGVGYIESLKLFGEMEA